MKQTLLLFALALIGFSSTAQIVTTVAGNGTGGYSGDNGQATAAKLNEPYALATDNSGNLYIADRMNFALRKVSPAGIITTIAGIPTVGHPDWSGDGGPATNAMISDVSGIAIDVLGNIYIADHYNNRVRKIDASGIITTVAGIASAGYSGDGLPAIGAQLREPRGVAVDDRGNIYISDAGNHCIRRVNPLGIISTIAGNGTPGYDGDGVPGTATRLHGPYGLAVDNDGNLLICDVDNARIRKIDATGVIYTIAGSGIIGYSGDDGPATDAKLQEPIGIAADNNGNIFIADGWNQRIRMMNSTGRIATVAGNGIAGYNGDGLPANDTRFNNPYGLAVGSGQLYIADNSNHRIRTMAKPTAVAQTTLQGISMMLSPNPATSYFNVLITAQQTEKVQITVSNVSGATISQAEGITNKPINICDLSANGICIVTATTATGSITRTIVLTGR